ncbi:ubiquinol-cytochrome c reductase complex assembly factor 4 [Garra rufa]|uniref:ubiquinol-cytochrome c reductase complex assembly factor 4 n=1 Tax=Garra rufa TaxID=137080 RepID=UPI003CCEC949
MSKVCVHLSRFSLGCNVFTNRVHGNLRPCVTRMLSLTSQRNAKSRKPPEDNEAASNPIQFSTSKASHRTWKVDRSMGSTYERPWWKVLPISLVGVGFLAWCIFRRESEIDDSLEKNLYEHLPGLLSDEEEDEVDIKNKPS